MSRFLEAMAERVLVLDGAMGTMLQARGLEPGQSPEELNLTRPEVVAAVHSLYAAAGADILVTNTFGGSRVKLAHYGLDDRVAEINRAGVEIARRAGGEGVLVGASIGPTGLFVAPVGETAFTAMVEIFAEQVRAFAAAGADLISLETFLDIRELKAALVACKEYSTLPVVAMMTFEDNGRSVLGTSPEAAIVTLDALGADVIGSNCGLGPDGIYDVLSKMRTVSARPLISQANAGLPVLRDGETIFPASPEEMTVYHQRMIALGVRVIGGCCGTTPDHIRAIKIALTPLDQHWVAPPRTTCYLSSRTAVTALGAAAPCAIIGERINPTGKKGYSAELHEGKTAYVRREGKEQSACGATLLDVNCGAPGVDEPLALERAVFALGGAVATPLVLDSSDPTALERGLQAADGKVLINSVSGEEKSLAKILPLARKYGAAIIGLALDEQGIPETAAGRLAVARKIKERALAEGIPAADIVIDCLTLTVSAEQKRAVETLKAIRRVRAELDLSTVLGVSNISFGLPARPILSASFFAMALEAGLDAAIINPKDARMMDAFRAAMVLLGKDIDSSAYIAHYADALVAPPTNLGDAPAAIREQLAQAIIGGDEEGIVALVEQALGDGLKPLEISNEGLLPGLEEVGRRFGSGQVFLPQVMRSAETMHRAFARIKEAMQGEDMPSRGRILMATVEGDIHDIGKNIVCTLLENHGFEVIDLGKNVAADRIVAAAQEHAVDAVGLSALMTTTIAQMDVVVERLRAAGVEVFTMIGGAVVSQDYAERIGADLYARDALEAVAKVKKLLEHRG
ncbi:MAG: homocysteine S-methyltransferase family protein [Desulfuromonadaceae bacterium]|nr:homocysteine S-methyltransferase family protein [Desulfuromonadaceae bacterium]